VKSDTLNAVCASFLGWTLDAFDFFILVFLLDKAGRELHASNHDQMTLAITATLAFRPLGALVFGLFADRYGRCRSMMINLVFFSVMEVFSGLAPNFVIFMICRSLFGIGMGGYWGSAAALSMEKVAPRWRGIASGLLQQGYSFGYLIAAFCFWLVPASWSWRSFFLVGGLPGILLAVFIHYRVSESDIWKQGARQDWRSYVQAVRGSWKLLLYLILLMAMMNFASHGTQDLYPHFLEQERHLTHKQVGEIAVIYNIGALLGGITFGLFSDRMGRRFGMVLAFILAAAVVPLWSGAASTLLLVVGAFLMQFMVQGAWGVIPAHINELSPTGSRGFLPGFAYQCGVLIAANTAHFEAQFAKNGVYSTPMARMALGTFVVGVIVIMLGPERRAAQFGINSSPDT
jgi:SHS family lactate transporter-like MFS transporter